ncbi:MAG: bile acid:sodium symporter family protein [Marinicaulis sp.]|nr:hypothetical protein [Marinicaulis sp.]NNE40352.1 bile acid:sodium symporter family protein [Marinicaulis sp.]NNL89155.1 bile acid:sodium symporter family protein [Marinicaulis sp.]
MSPEALDKIIIAIDPASQLLLAASIVTLMFAIALGLKPENFAFLKTSPRLFWGGLFAQIIALPLMTIALAAGLGVGPSVALGMIVVAACPGGSVSNFMTYLSRGDVAYSVSLTAGSSIIAAFWTPFAIIFWSDIYPPTSDLLEIIEFNRAGFVAQTTIMLAAPLIAGMTIARYAPSIADRIKGPLAILGGLTMGGVIVYSVLDFIPLIKSAWALILIPVAIHNAAAFAMGAGAGWALRGNAAQRRSLTFEVGIQNAGLAVVLMLSQLDGLGGGAAVAASWGVWHFFSGGAMIAFFRMTTRSDP